jgi:hypothetical protein
MVCLMGLGFHLLDKGLNIKINGFRGLAFKNATNNHCVCMNTNKKENKMNWQCH